MFCTECGSELAKQAIFCHRCGNAIGGALEPKPKVPQGATKRVSRLTLLLGALLIIGLIALVVVGRVKQHRANQELERQRQEEASRVKQEKEKQKQEEAEKHVREEQEFQSMTLEQHFSEGHRLDFQVGNTRKGLQLSVRHYEAIPINSPRYKKAQSRLPQVREWLVSYDERMRSAMGQIEDQAQARARQAVARELDTSFLDQGINATVTTEGDRNEILRIEYVLANRVYIHQLRRQLQWRSLLQNGFQKVIVSNGRDSWQFHVALEL